MIRPVLLSLPLLAVAAGGAILVGDRLATAIEAEATTRADDALAAAGAGWAQVTVSGLRATATGEAPDADRRRQALAAVEAAAPWVTVIDRVTLSEAQPAFAPTPEVEILRDAAGFTVTGAAPGAAAREALAEALRTAAPRLALADLSRDDASAPTTGDAADRALATDWTDAAPTAAAIAADLHYGRVRLAPPEIAATGLPIDDAAKARIETRLAALSEAGWRIAADLSAPSPAPGVFELTAEMDADGGALLACAAGTEAEAQAILEAAAPLFPRRPETCRIAPGASDADWPAAAAAALNAVAALPAGRVEIIDRRARLTANAPTPRDALEAAHAGLAAALPPGYQLATLAPPSATGDALPDAEPTAATPPAAETTTRLAFDGALLRLSGAAPSPILGEAAAAAARARLAGVEVEAAFDFAPAGLDGNDWRAAMATMTEALTRLSQGEARLAPDLAEIEGEIADPGGIRALHDLVADGVGAGRTVRTRFAVSPARQAADAPLPAGRCAAAMTAIVAETPIAFAPGADALAPEAAPVVARLVEALAPCVLGPIEIGGHTDSQGSEEMNAGLSRARARAVLDAMLALGADPDMLSAAGYGEARPIADNATEEGRARNRRIEFLAPTDESAAAAEADADGAGAGETADDD